jgi:hypothetical protein
MKDRFNLEEEISELYNFADQLGTISKGVLKYDLSPDDTSNALNGLRVLLNLHAQKLHDTMNQCFRLDQYNNDIHSAEDYYE